MIKYKCDKCGEETETHRKSNYLVGYCPKAMYQVKFMKQNQSQDRHFLDEIILCEDCLMSLLKKENDAEKQEKHETKETQSGNRQAWGWETPPANFGLGDAVLTETYHAGVKKNTLL